MYTRFNTRFTVLQKISLIIVILLLFSFTGCKSNTDKTDAYDYAEIPLERNGIELHLDRMCIKEQMYEKNILLVHGLTYSSHEFDIDYKDYSLVRFFASEGYTVWRIDIAGYGRSSEVKNGFMPDSDNASSDISSAVDKILKLSGKSKIDILGWSWGTVTTSRFAYDNPECINKLILYAPILTGLGYSEVDEEFHINSWEDAASDFQKKLDGTFDYDITEKEIIEMYCSSCWHYDGIKSPNGGRKDLCVEKSKSLIFPEKIKVPTFVIYGSSDPYINKEAIKNSSDKFSTDSSIEVIKGASHVMMYEKPYYHSFRKKIIDFLKK